jgi:hypothetical protein
MIELQDEWKLLQNKQVLLLVKTIKLIKLDPEMQPQKTSCS